MRNIFAVIKLSVVCSTLLCLCAVQLVQAQSPTAESPLVGIPKAKWMWTHLERDIQREAESLDGYIAVGVCDLRASCTGSFFINPDEPMPQASSIKIVVLLELYKQAQGGRLKLDDVYTVRKEDLVQDSDIMNGLTPGVSKITLRDLATMMMAVSDNAATNVLIDKVGMAQATATMQSLGLKNTRLARKMMDLKAAHEGRENISTAREMVTLLRSVYEGKVLNKPYADEFWKMLATHKADSHMRQAIPDEVMVASKHGWLEGVRAESGVVFVEGRPFIVTVMTSYLRDEKEGEAVIGRITRKAYDYFSRMARSSEYGRVISTK